MTRRDVRVRGLGCILVLALLILASVSVLSPAPPYASGSSHLLRQDPILIEGDGAFTPQNGVVRGAGSRADPYIIEGWEIEARAGNGVEIRDTYAHVILRDLNIHSGASSLHRGIWLFQASNVVIEGVRIEGNSIGIQLTSVTDVLVTDSDIRGNRLDGVWSTNPWNVTVRGSTFFDNGRDGLALSSPRDVNVVDNQIASNERNGILAGGLTEGTVNLQIARNALDLNQDDGIELRDVADATLVENVILGSGGHGLHAAVTQGLTIRQNAVGSSGRDGVFMVFSGNATLTGNRLHANAAGGVTAAFSNDLTISGNDFVMNDEWGLGLFDSRPVRVYHNNFVDNTVQALDDERWENVWDDGYPRGGNYWSDYEFSDRCGGPNQTVCNGSDGIGDLPWVITPGLNRDRYPLMSPYAVPDPVQVPSLNPVSIGVLVLLAAVYGVLIFALFRRKRPARPLPGQRRQ